MISGIDAFASDLFEEAKRFLEKAKETKGQEGEIAFLHAALLLGVSSLEAQINAISAEMAEREGLNILEKSVLLEKDYSFDDGVFRLTNNLKMYRLVDRIEFLFSKFSLQCGGIDKNTPWWGKLLKGLDTRNSLVHPKDSRTLTYDEVEQVFDGIIGLLDTIYSALYDQPFPARGRRLQSKMYF